MAVIYGLCDPTTGQLRYIGKANDLSDRLKRHLRCKLTKTPVQCWIAKLVRGGSKPEAFEIESADNWIEAERFWIAYFRSLGAALLNLAPGGNEPGADAARKAAIIRETGPNAQLNKALRTIGQNISLAMRARNFTSAYIMRFKLKCYRAT